MRKEKIKRERERGKKTVVAITLDYITPNLVVLSLFFITVK